MKPSSGPSASPVKSPSSQPSLQRSSEPSSQPSAPPSEQPSSQPSSQPSTKPSYSPSGRPSTSLSPSGQPTFICTPLPLLEGIYIKDDGRIVDSTAVTTASQCTASSDTVSETATFSRIGKWDPTAGLGIKIDNNSVSTAGNALVVGSNNSNRVVVRDQTFDANAVFTSSLCLSRKLGAKLESSSKATFCRSTFKDSEGSNCTLGNHGVENNGGSLNIVDSILEGGSGKAGLLVFGAGKTVIVGESTHIRSLGGSSGFKFAPAILISGGTLDVYQGTFGQGQEYSLTVAPFSGSTAVANIYGGEWKSKLSQEIGGTLNVYVKDLVTKNELCDGNPFDTTKVFPTSNGADVNYFPCPCGYQVPIVPIFPECD